ncbi:hypothetical protein GF354_03215, partial [Candidatus Peregrinibacteria bacterium]|nr:hypothetical protein [Candidatus Peregrinibacteria bacterium]
RGGAGFPTHKKWEFVKAAEGSPKYVICNASEGEMGVFKDLYILENHLEEVFEGMKLAMDYLETNKAYFNINEEYWNKLNNKIEQLAEQYEKDNYIFTIYKEPPSYIGGEETALLNAIEGDRIEPRLKPPYPASQGLYGKPSLINNVETFYNVFLADKGMFDRKRFYAISGKVRNPGVYYLPDFYTIEKILNETDNWPTFEFFVQIGGSASGPVFRSDQLAEQEMTGAGSIEVYSEKTTEIEILKKWFEFYKKESCGKCTPCREGSYQLFEMIKEIDDVDEIPWKNISKIINNMEQTSFCALGKSLALPIKTYTKNILHKNLL